MVIIENSIDKQLIPAMPQVTYPGTVYVVNTIPEALSAIDYLKGYKIVGFDTETKPSFKKGVSHKTALLQLSTHQRAYLFRLNIIGLPDFVRDFLTCPDVLKIGLSVKDDFNSLYSHAHFEPSSFVDLQTLASEMGIEEKGLQRLYALLFGERISKNQQLSNWESDELSDGQCQYAAIDAWACVVIYEYLMKLRLSGEYQIIKRNAEESNSEER